MFFLFTSNLVFIEFFYFQIIAILPLALVHTLGNLFTNMSLGKVAVSFTHTIKALEPFFSVLLSALVLAEVRTLVVFLSSFFACIILSYMPHF